MVMPKLQSSQRGKLPFSTLQGLHQQWRPARANKAILPSP